MIGGYPARQESRKQLSRSPSTPRVVRAEAKVEGLKDETRDMWKRVQAAKGNLACLVAENNILKEQRRGSEYKINQLKSQIAELKARVIELEE